MDDTLDRVKVKNKELKDQLRLLIQQETVHKPKEWLGRQNGEKLMPIDINTDKPAMKPERKTSKESDSPKASGISRPEFRSAGPGQENTQSFKPVGTKSFTRNESTKPIFTRVNETKPIFTPGYVADTKRTSAGSSLLVDKITQQKDEITQLKHMIKQLKHDNNILQQQNYSKMQTINDLKLRESENVVSIRHELERRVYDEKMVNEQLVHKLKGLKADLQASDLRIQDKDNELMIVKEIIQTLNNEVTDFKSKEDANSEKVENLKTYNKLVKRFVQSNIVNKFTDNFDKVGTLLDERIYPFGDYNDVVVDDEDITENTTNLINHHQDDTTNILLSSKTYSSVEKLIVCNIKAPRTPRTRLRGYIRFIICLNRFKRQVSGQ
ncbi:hypothetical protein PSN45_004740 [Yamadazyma tenuis]|uniref:uncharacterized protein n=1 Tax=Candida tenuis TaxID=2315449 RepID=UPI00279DDD33|nr:hypothetical protein PSN45_004740 [Yamadazyma tenuis]